MNIGCEVIKDLLPLYHDNVCSNESKQLVEEHLLECESCRAELTAIEENLLVIDEKQNLEDAEAMKNLSKRWKSGMKMALFQGVTIAITIIVICLFISIFVGFKIV